MEKNQRCGNCRFWRLWPGRERWIPDDGADRRPEPGESRDYAPGVCGRYPPVAHRHPGGQFDQELISPVLEELHWCGEWQAEKPATVELTVLALARQCLAGDLEAGRVLADRVMELTGGDT